MKYKYNDLVKVIIDTENDGFFVGTEGIIKEYTLGVDTKAVRYALEIGNGSRYLWCKEEELEDSLK